MLGDAEELKAEYMLVEDYHITEMQDLLQCLSLIHILSMMIDREPLTNVCGGSQPLPWENTIRP